jgi:capsular polysaccharide export protein
MSGTGPQDMAAGAAMRRRLYFCSGGFLWQKRLRGLLKAAGYDLRPGLPSPGDLVAVWGASPFAARGERLAASRGAGLLRIEDAFLRSVLPGRAGGGPPLGLLLDPDGLHCDPSRPSALERILAQHPLDDHALLTRARDGIELMRAAHLSKYTGFDPGAEVPKAPFVLVVDQTHGDAAVRLSGAAGATFREMLAVARDEHPGAHVVIKTHPETLAGQRRGHFSPDDAGGNVTLLADAVSPWALFDHAQAVYTVSSQMGFEAILAGHRPRVFGQPWYAGWGLSTDENPVARRQRRLTRVQLFAAAMILAPVWYDPFEDRLGDFETALLALDAETRAWREDRNGWVATGMRLWKRGPLQDFLGGRKAVRFVDPPGRAQQVAARRGRLVGWAGRVGDDFTGLRMEDGFLRSRGLGAELVPPLSLALDDLGIYYDPRRESRLERLIADSPKLGEGALRRARALREVVVGAGLSKYNLAQAGAAPLSGLPNRPRILVPGQVEDDASIRLGCGAVRTNLALLRAVREANPEALILYKPHPDVEAGLRPGLLPEREALSLADQVLVRANPALVLGEVDAVWTMTSLLGFEALMRGVPVTCLGAPFYAGWGLTRDLGPALPRRRAKASLDGLVHAALIAYPRYHDPVSGRPCPPEVALRRMAQGHAHHGGPGLRALARLQGLVASQAHFWR